MATGSFKVKKSINLDPQSGSVVSAKGDIAYNTASDKLELYNGAVDSIVQEAKSATLTNKVLSGNTAVTLISGSGTLTLNTSGTVTLPNATDTLVGKATTDILTNKTFDAEGTGNSLSNVKNSNIKAAAAIDLTKLAAATASRALVSDGSGFIVAATTTATEIGYVNGVTSSIQTQFGTKVDKATLTTTGDMYYASSASTPARLAVGSANQVIKSVGGLPVWSAAPTGGVNYLSANPDAESDTSGWSTYADAAGNVPVDGTGGSPSSTWTRSTSSPLRGSASFLWTKAGSASRQGEGVAYAFTIDSADLAKTLTISFDYSVASGTLTASDGITAPKNDGTTTTNAGNSDLEVFIYDVTNSILRPVSPQVLLGNQSVSYTFKGTFQTPTSGTSYRLVIHTATSTTNNFVVKFDNFFVGPASVAYGAPIIDWTAYTVGLTGASSNPSKGSPSVDQGYYRRIGDSLQIRYDFKSNTGSSGGSGIYIFSLPSGLTIDTSKLSGNSASFAAQGNVGTCVVTNGNSTSSAAVGTVFVYNSTNLSLRVLRGDTALAYSDISDSIYGLGSAGVQYSFIAQVPIVGWSSNVLMSNDAASRVVAFTATTSSQTPQAASSGTAWALTKVIDTHGGFASGSNTYVIPVSGFYNIQWSADGGTASSSALNAYMQANIYQNGSLLKAATLRNQSTTSLANWPVNANYTGSFVAGDVVKVNMESNFTTPGTTGFGTLSISQIQGPASIALDPAQALTPVGTVTMFAGSTAPYGWLLCDGSAVSRTQYAALFAIISTSYGVGDGSTTFNIPNTQGLFVRGSGSQTVSGTAYTGTLASKVRDQIQDHQHGAGSYQTGTLPTNPVEDVPDNYNLRSGAGGFHAYTFGSSPAPSGISGTSGSSNARAGSETFPANISFNYIIKT